RDGTITKIATKNLVVGDLVILTAGARVPADIRLIEVIDCTIDEALLTGEAVPVKKTVQTITKTCPIGDRTNMAYAGTYVLNGKAYGLVVATGINTELGKIAQLVSNTQEQETPLQKQMTRFSWFLTLLLTSMIAIVMLIGLIKKIAFLEIITIAIALAVAAIPEGLVIAVTTILAIGMHRMLKQKALVRHLVAAETLGSISIICTDKTGTLTEGHMQVTRIITHNYDTNISGKWDDKNQELQEILIAGICNNDAYFVKDKIVGNSTEQALLRMAQEAKLDIPEIQKKYTREQEIPFCSDKKYMATVHKTNTINNADNNKWLIVKGAPEEILPLCNGNTERFKTILHAMAQDGLRILAIAHKKAQNINLNDTKDLNNLELLGLFGIQDPLRPEAIKTIEELKQAGIRTIIITGDHKETAINIAQQVGLATEPKNIMTGEELDNISDQELHNKIQDICIFARVEPAHKIKIVQAWQKLGHSVAMTGDGVNDAPALKASDIGVALGSGSDVTHEVADMVLLDNNLATITSAVNEGRVIFDNIRKVIVYLLACSFNEIILIGGAMLCGLPLPLLAAQILWINLVTHGFPNLALIIEKGEPNIMHESPRKKTESIINNEMKTLIFIIGIATEIGLFLLYAILFYYNLYDIKTLRTIIFTSITVNSLFYVFSIRSMRTSIFKTNPFSNIWLLIAVAFSLCIQLVAVYVPQMQILFQTVPLGLQEWLIIFALALAKLCMIEITKEYFMKKKYKKALI
ncbi:MAG: cation-transporting P-type ATPase, partial [bacterium]